LLNLVPGTANQARVMVDGMVINGREGGRGGGVAGGVPGGVVFNSAVAAAPPAPGFQQAETARVEDFYEYTFPFAVRLASRQSALLPFLQKTMPMERLSIFNARADRGNPRLGARIENTTDIPFEPGPVTFFQEARYTGEAVLDYLPRGEKALVSYGVDYDIQIASQAKSQPETTVRTTVSKGIAVLFAESVLTTTYEIRNRGTDAKTLIVEHPRQNDRTLKGLAPFETTEGFHRFRLALAPRQATTLPVAEIVARQTRIALTTLTRPQLALFAGGATPQNVRERLGQIVDLQEQLAAMRSDVATTQADIDIVFRDQDRLRENLKALRDGSEEQQLRSRYLAQLQAQEDEIGASRARIVSINTNIVALQARLDDLISNFAFGI
jgi:hypothetical protein